MRSMQSDDARILEPGLLSLFILQSGEARIGG